MLFPNYKTKKSSTSINQGSYLVTDCDLIYDLIYDLFSKFFGLNLVGPFTQKLSD